MRRFGGRRRSAPLYVSVLLAIGLGVVRATPSAGTTSGQLMLDVSAKLSDSHGRAALHPRVVVTRNGGIFVAWQEEGATAPGLNDVLYRYLPAGPGATWQPTAPGTAALFAESPALATYAGDEVGLAFVSVSPVEPRQAQLKLWNPTTRRWPVRANALGGIGIDGVEPDLAFQPDGTLWMVWVSTHYGGRRPHWARLVNGTVQAGALMDACFSFAAYWPRIAVAANGDQADAVHVVWSNDQAAAGASIQHAYRSQGETGWTCNDIEWNHLQSDPLHQRLPDVAATSRDNVCLVWQEGDGPLGPGQKQEIIRTCKPWSQTTNVSDSQARSIAPSLALAPDPLGLGALTMWELQQSKQVWFSRATPPLKAPVSDNAHSPDVTFDPRTGDVHAVWAENAPQGGSEIYYARWSVLPPSATPTATGTPRPTRTPTPTPSASPSGTPASPSPTPSPGDTPLPSLTVEATPTPPDGSLPPSPSPSPPASDTPTATETETPAATATPRGMMIYLPLAFMVPPESQRR